MSYLRIAGLGALLAALDLGAASGQEKTPPVGEKEFRRAGLLLLEDPLDRSARDHARAILVFTLQTPKAAVVLGKEEMKWAGEDKERGLLLLAAYASGNVGSQLNSGVKRNDRYAGLLSLFRVYRALRERDDKFRNPEVEALLKLHRADRLMPYVLKLEEKSPTKLSPQDEEAVKKFREKK